MLFFIHKVQQRRYLRANWKCMMSMLIIRTSNANHIWVGLLILIMLIEIDYINWTLSGNMETMNHVFVSVFERFILSLVMRWERCVHFFKLVTDLRSEYPGARDFSCSVSGFCQVFIVTRSWLRPSVEDVSAFCQHGKSRHTWEKPLVPRVSSEGIHTALIFRGINIP